jgi:hypothetical protein
MDVLNSLVCVALGCEEKAEYVVQYRENGMNSNPLCHKHLKRKVLYLLNSGLYYKVFKFEDDKVKVEFT